MIKKICDNCKKEYEARNSVQQKNKHFFCCLDCMYKYDKLYEKLKNDLKNNGFTSIRKWSKMYKVSNSWVIKNKKAILKDLKNAT